MSNSISHVRAWMAALMATVLSLGGCATVVYKDAAASYVAASKDLTKQLDEVSGRLTLAEDMQRRQAIVTDPMCPIDKERIFVRSDPPVTFTPQLQRMPLMVTNFPDCKVLLACERGDAPSACKRACYTGAEANCLVNLEKEYARADAQLAAQADRAAERKQLAIDAQELTKNLHVVEYQRSDALTSRLISDSLHILAQYLDLLQKASTAHDIDFSKDVKRITDKIDTATSGYTKLTGEQLSTGDTATRDNIKTTIGLLGTFGAHLKTMQANAKDAEQIKAFVRTNAGVATSLIESVENVVSGDDYLGVVYYNDAVLKERKAIMGRYQKKPSPYERGVLLDEALKYRYTSADASQKKLKEVFVALERSHAALNSLVLDPDKEQWKAIHSEEFQNFRTVVEDAAALIGQVAKL